MVSFTLYVTLFAAAVSAVAVEQPAARSLHKRITCTGGSLPYGEYACADASNGSCQSCGIVEGGANGECEAIADCGDYNGSCYYTNGQPYCR